MKKILITMYLILLSFFTMTFKVQAYTTSISNAEITGTDLVQTNTSFSQSFKVNFSNLKKGTTDTLGIWLVGYELVYDDTILIIEDISNDGSVWDSVIFKDDGKIYVISEFANDPFKIYEGPFLWAEHDHISPILLSLSVTFNSFLK